MPDIRRCNKIPRHQPRRAVPRRKSESSLLTAAWRIVVVVAAVFAMAAIAVAVYSRVAAVAVVLHSVLLLAAVVATVAAFAAVGDDEFDLFGGGSRLLL